jgi:hypothetical protein
MRHRSIQNHPYPIPCFAEYDKQHDEPAELRTFIDLSVALTGFTEADLQSTGLVMLYFDELALVVGRTIRGRFLKQAAGAPGTAMKDGNLWQPLAQNLLRLWYLGQWKRMPECWAKAHFDDASRKDYDEFGRDADRVISPRSYQEGLVWRAIGVNPPGAKQPGFASWGRADDE